MKQQRLLLSSLLIVLTIGPATAWGKNNKPTSTVITDCTTISQPGSYELGNVIIATSGNLQGPAHLPDNQAAACILIAADFVTLDLKGYSIIGIPSNPTGPPANRVFTLGISTDAQARSGINVHSGLITNFDEGIFLEGKSHNVDHIRAIKNIFIGIDTQLTQGGRIVGNTADDNGSLGIDAGCPALLLENEANGNAVGIAGTNGVCRHSHSCLLSSSYSHRDPPLRDGKLRRGGFRRVHASSPTRRAAPSCPSWVSFASAKTVESVRLGPQPMSCLYRTTKTSRMLSRARKNFSDL